MDAVSWAAVLPQMLAALGAMFALAGVGPIVAELVERWIPLDTPFAAVATYTVGMALFTVIMGNAFAAFPVMTAGIGLPLDRAPLRRRRRDHGRASACCPASAER